jgi:methionine-R-sulfoxide reductase
MLTWKDVLQLATSGTPAPARKVTKTDAEWRQQLGADAYQVARRAGTEAPFSSDMCSLFQPGIYGCVCCGTVLFDATTKFESGTGWPSFTQPLDANAVAYNADESHDMTRIEAVCTMCDAHLGHVFPDGPAPSGLRYCMNALALKKVMPSAA